MLDEATPNDRDSEPGLKAVPNAGASGEDWQDRAREFARSRLRVYALQTIVSLAFPLLFWLAGWSSGLSRLLASAIDPFWARAILFVVVYQAITAVIFLPFSYYSGFVLQHRFGLSTQNVSGWLSDWAKSAVIGTVFFVVGLLAFYLVVPAYPDAWWWILATGLTVVALVMTYVAPVLLLPVFYKRTPLEDGELAERITALAAKAGAHVSHIYTIDMSRRTVAANAALTGIGSTRQVLLGDTMLREFSLDETETVVAHEFGHHVHGDIWKGLVAEVLGGWIGLFLLWRLVQPAFLAAGLGSVAELANLPLLLLLGEVASLAAMPVANAISRHYEAEADAFAARTSRMPERYGDALYRLARQNLSELWPPRLVEILFYTHPAIGRRMQAIGRRRE